MDTMHPNQNEKNYNNILAFLLGWPWVAGWNGLAVEGKATCLSIWTIWELSGNYPGTIRDSP